MVPETNENYISSEFTLGTNELIGLFASPSEGLLTGMWVVKSSLTGSLHPAHMSTFLPVGVSSYNSNSLHTLDPTTVRPHVIRTESLQLAGRQTGYSGEGPMTLLAPSFYEGAPTVTNPAVVVFCRQAQPAYYEMAGVWLRAAVCNTSLIQLNRNCICKRMP